MILKKKVGMIRVRNEQDISVHHNMSYFNFICKNYERGLKFNWGMIWIQYKNMMLRWSTMIKLYLLCKILGCWAWVGCSTLRLKWFLLRIFLVIQVLRALQIGYTLTSFTYISTFYKCLGAHSRYNRKGFTSMKGGLWPRSCTLIVTKMTIY